MLMYIESWKKGTGLTSQHRFLKHLGSTCVLREAEKNIVQKDQMLLLAKVSKYQHIHKITMEIGWKKLWDQAIDHGLPVVKSMKNLLRALTHPDHAKTKRPLCNTEESDLCLLEHFRTEHTKSKGTANTLLDSLITMDPSFFQSCSMLFKCFFTHSAHLLINHPISICLIFTCTCSLFLLYVYLGLRPSGPIRHEHYVTMDILWFGLLFEVTANVERCYCQRFKFFILARD